MSEASPPPAGDRRGATSYDVAKVAGVSQSAVSRCFKPGASVAPKTRAKILAAANALSYQPNAIAQGLITRRSHMVAVIISNLTNLYYPEVLAELTQRFSERGIRVLLFALKGESEVASVTEQVLRFRVDGVVAAARLTPAQVGDYERRGVPVVLYNRRSPTAWASAVSCDFEAGGRLLAAALWSAGHRRFGIVTGPADSSVGEERVRAARTRLAELGATSVRVERGDFSYASGQAALGKLLGDGEPPQAIVCANDSMALGAIDAARLGHGLRIPEDLSVVGFDGVEPSGWAAYRLTTVRQPVRHMAEAAVALLTSRIEDAARPSETRTFMGEFVRGASARLG